MLDVQSRWKIGYKESTRPESRNKQCLILFLLFVNVQIAQAQFSLTSISRNYGSGTSWLSYRFPVIQGKNKLAARNINRELQREVLDNDRILTDSNKIFQTSRYISNDSINQSGYSEIEYSVLLNNSNVLSLQFDMESTGAYSTNFPLYFSFDSKTGKQIVFDALFKPGIRSVLKQKLLRERKKRISQFIKEDYSDSNDSTFIRETYDECLSEGDISNVYIKSESVVFYKEYCFPHVARPYDTDLDVELSIKQLRPWLTTYGKTIFNTH